nr:hypothetical protein [Tanacetum cinerariifolium]
MLEKELYDSWKIIMELYMMNRQHERIILKSVENGPLIWPTIEENGVTRPRKYNELTPTEALQADCDLRKHFKLSVMSRKQISFFKAYQMRSMHLLAIIKSPKVSGKEFNFSCKERP